jgi:hypothetical protein
MPHPAHVLRPALLVRPDHPGQGRTARREREDHVVPREHQVGAVRRLAAQQHRLGAVAHPLLGHPAAGVALRGRRVAPGLRGQPGGARRARRTEPLRAGPAPPLCRRRSTDLCCRGLRGHHAPRPRGDRRLVRLGVDAVRAVGLPPRAGLGRAVRERLSGAVHLRGDRPDPWLVLHADGRQHDGARTVVVRERALPRAHRGRGRPQDEQAPRQHPAARPPHGGARRRRAALVHGRERLAVAAAPGGSRRASGDRPQDPADVLEHGLVPTGRRWTAGRSPSWPAWSAT